MNPSSNGLLRTYQADLSASIQRLDTLEKEHQRLKKKIRSKKRRKSLNSYDEDSEEDDSWKLLKENANVHGLKDLFFTSSSKLKVTWILLLILAAILTVHGCYTIIVEYLVGRVVVSYFVYEASDLPLPDLVICPLNRFNRTFLENLNVSAGLAQYMELSFPLYPMHPFQQPTFDAVMGNTDFYNNELELLLTRLGNMTYRDFLNKASLPCEAFMDNPDDCANSTEIYCSAGKCFRIPGDTQYSAGFATGDHRIINLPTESYSPAANQIPNDGIIVKLVEKGMGIDNDFTFVPTGVHAIFPITAVKYEFMNDPPKYMCQEESNYTYSSVYCFEECFVEEAEAVCNCSLAGATTPRKAITCTAQQYFNCFFPQLSALGFDKNKKCRSQCPPPCTYWEYEKARLFCEFSVKIGSLLCER
ncbi:unnamed protein product, partial [Mesorhabditis belari]|uniref:Sodium channel protein Nach n=1 Tax=Mesorhabditis belari TaxID=2138241 RepID=A0AAF3JAN2_9BILA